MPINIRPPDKLNYEGLDVKGFTTYLEAFEDYFNMLQTFDDSKVTFDDPLKVKMFFTTAGMDTRQLVSGLTHDGTFKGITKAIVNYLKPICNPIIERHVFFTMDQSMDEDLPNFLVRLKQQVKKCDFSDISVDTLDNQLVRDQFIRGIKNKTIRESLLKEGMLTLAKAEQLANCAAAAEINNELISKSVDSVQQGTTLHVSKANSKTGFNQNIAQQTNANLQRNENSSSSSKQNRSKIECFTCHKIGHIARDCYRNKKCDNCSRFGHTANYCRNNRQKSQTKSKDSTLTLLHSGNAPLLFEKILFRGGVAHLVVDTGSTISILRREFIYRANFFLMICDYESKAANGSFIKFRHFIEGDVVVRGSTFNSRFFVTDEFDYDGILGLDLINLVGLSVSHEHGMTFSVLPAIAQKFKDVFNKPLKDCVLHGIEPFEMVALRDGADPSRCHVRKLSQQHENIMKEKVSELLEHKVIRESTSEWRHQPFLVPKDGTGHRMVINYKPVNAVTVTDAYPIAPMQEIFDKIGESKVFTKIDFQQFYHQLPLVESDIPKTAFYVDGKLYEYVRVPFGLTNAVAYCYRMMQKVFKDCPGVEIYLDDVLVHAKTRQEHDENLERVFQRIRQYNLGVNLDKCSFAQPEVKYLGFIIGGGIQRPDPDRFQSVLDFPLPNDAKSLQRFIGMCGFFQNFIPKYSDMASVFYKKLENFGIWTDSEKSTFTKVKEAISKAVLHFPKNNEKLALYTDASDVCVAGFLVNECNQPVQFCSRKLTPTETRYDIVEKEALAIYWCVQRCRNFLLGRHFVVYSDHQPLRFLFNNEKASNKVLRWRLALSEYDFEVKYLNGGNNVVADCLSRVFIVDEVDEVISIGEVILRQKFCKETKAFIEAVNNRPQSCPKEISKTLRSLRKQAQIKEGALYINSKMFVPFSLRRKILSLAHGAHWGQEATYASLKESYFWPGMKNQTNSFVKECRICSLVKPNFKKPPLGPVITKSPFECLACDFAILPESNGFKYLLVVVDVYSRYPFIFPTKSMEAATVIEKFAEIFSMYGYPDAILSDRGANFESETFQTFCKNRHIKKLRTTSYHPEGNGLCERFNRTIKQLIFSLLTSRGLSRNQWPKVLNEAAHSYRFSLHSTTNFRPIDLFVGFRARGNLEMINSSNVKNALLNTCKNLYSSKQKVDKNRNITTFKKGDEVLVKTPHHITFGPKGQLAEIEEDINEHLVVLKGTSGCVNKARVAPIAKSNPSYFSRDRHGDSFSGSGISFQHSSNGNSAEDYEHSSDNESPWTPQMELNTSGGSCQPRQGIRKSTRITAKPYRYDATCYK